MAHDTPLRNCFFIFNFFIIIIIIFLEQSWVLRCTPGDFLGRVDFFFLLGSRETDEI